VGVIRSTGRIGAAGPVRQVAEIGGDVGHVLRGERDIHRGDEATARSRCIDPGMGDIAHIQLREVESSRPLRARCQRNAGQHHVGAGSRDVDTQRRISGAGTSSANRHFSVG
jgi:hypothetical protein